MKREGDASTRARILQTTGRMLFSVRPGELTTRRIAAESKVNIAAINYHFGSKDALLEEAFEAGAGLALHKGLEILLDPEKEPMDRLREFFRGYTYGMMKYPLLIKTAFLSFFTRDSETNPYGRYTREMIENVGRVVAEMNGWQDGEEGRARAVMIASGVIFPFLAASTVRQTEAVDFGDEAARGRYIESLLTLLTRKSEG